MSPKKKILFKNQNSRKKHGEKRLLPGCYLLSARNPQFHLVNYPVISALWQLSEVTAYVPPWRGSDPPNHRPGASKSKEKILFKNQNFMKKHGAKRLLPGCCLLSVRNPQNPLVKYPVISALWQLSEATA